jgi:hydroxypyruvate isomerase
VPRFAANISFLFTELPFLDRVQAAAQAGFGAVECHYPYDEVSAGTFRKALARTGVSLLGINTRNGTGDRKDAGVAAVPEQAEESRARLRQAVAYATEAGGRAIHVTTGNAHPDDAAAQDAFVDALREASRLGPDLTILIEPLNRRQNPDYFLRGSDQAVAILDRVGCSNVKLMFDIYHAQINEGDILMRIATLLPRIGHIQIAAVPSRAEPDEGELSYRQIFAELDRMGYAGWIGAEYRPRGTTVDGLGWLNE